MVLNNWCEFPWFNYLCTFLNILFSKYRTCIISFRGYYSFLRVLQAILFSKIKVVTKGAGTNHAGTVDTTIRIVFCIFTETLNCVYRIACFKRYMKLCKNFVQYRNLLSKFPQPSVFF